MEKEWVSPVTNDWGWIGSAQLVPERSLRVAISDVLSLGIGHLALGQNLIREELGHGGAFGRLTTSAKLLSAFTAGRSLARGHRVGGDERSGRLPLFLLVVIVVIVPSVSASVTTAVTASATASSAATL